MATVVVAPLAVALTNSDAVVRAHAAEMLGWLVHEHGIEPHIPVFDKSSQSASVDFSTTSWPAMAFC